MLHQKQLLSAIDPVILALAANIKRKSPCYDMYPEFWTHKKLN
jgi:hypothetical protein